MTERPEGTPEEATTPEIEPEPAAAEEAPAEPEPAAAEPAAAEPEPEPAAAEGPAAAEAAVVGTARRREVAPATPPRAPTPSEVATRVTDPASRIFVIGSVVIFVAILIFGMVGGNGGLLTTTPSPTLRPVLVSPAPSASAAPSPTAVASPSPS